MAHGPRYGHFLPLTIIRTPLPELQKMKWPYLGSWTTNKKSKDTLLSQTLKVEEKKVSLVFHFRRPLGSGRHRVKIHPAPTLLIFPFGDYFGD